MASEERTRALLEDAGFVRVVRTRPVRAMTERYYGRTARTFMVGVVNRPSDQTGERASAGVSRGIEYVVVNVVHSVGP